MNERDVDIKDIKKKVNRNPVPRTPMKVMGNDQTGSLSSLEMISDAVFSSISIEGN